MIILQIEFIKINSDFLPRARERIDVGFTRLDQIHVQCSVVSFSERRGRIKMLRILLNQRL